MSIEPAWFFRPSSRSPLRFLFCKPELRARRREAAQARATRRNIRRVSLARRAAHCVIMFTAKDLARCHRRPTTAPKGLASSSRLLVASPLAGILRPRCCLGLLRRNSTGTCRLRQASPLPVPCRMASFAGQAHQFRLPSGRHRRRCESRVQPPRRRSPTRPRRRCCGSRRMVEVCRWPALLDRRHQLSQRLAPRPAVAHKLAAQVGKPLRTVFPSPPTRRSRLRRPCRLRLPCSLTCRRRHRRVVGIQSHGSQRRCRLLGPQIICSPCCMASNQGSRRTSNGRSPCRMPRSLRRLHQPQCCRRNRPPSRHHQGRRARCLRQ